MALAVAGVVVGGSVAAAVIVGGAVLVAAVPIKSIRLSREVTPTSHN